jgi:hypothetical protein
MTMTNELLELDVGNSVREFVVNVAYLYMAHKIFLSGVTFYSHDDVAERTGCLLVSQMKTVKNSTADLVQIGFSTAVSLVSVVQVCIHSTCF